MARRRYIVMPVEGWRSTGMLRFNNQEPLGEIVRVARLEARTYVQTGLVPVGAARLPVVGAPTYRVIATSREDGPKLIDMSTSDASKLSRELPNAIIEPEQRVVAAVRAAARIRPAAGWGSRATRDSQPIRFRVVARDGEPVRGARILVFADQSAQEGAVARSRRSGGATVRVPRVQTSLPRVSVEPPPGYRGLNRVAVSAAAGEVTLTLDPVDPAVQDATHRWRNGLDPHAGRGVRIGIVDTGVDAHPDLAHVHLIDAYRQDLDLDLPPHRHATHVAGLIGARGEVFRGIAPESELFSYRVTPLGSRETGSFYLGDGVEKAATDQDLHLINVSMTCANPSSFLSKAGAVAYQNGAVCIAAAGNEGADSIAHPAAGKRFLAITAYGDEAFFKADDPELADLSDISSSLLDGLWRAKFSNRGPETDFIGPGVGITSCLASGGYAVDSGTSFATPVLTGLAAAMLSQQHPHILAMPKGPDRASAITRALLEQGRDLGFEFETQGSGIINAV